MAIITKAVQSWTEEEADALFMSIGDGAIVINDRGVINRINQKALDILGLTREAVLGKWYTDVIIAQDEQGERIPNLERPITEVFISGKTISTRLCYRRPNQNPIMVHLSVSPIKLNGKPIGAIEVFRDISEEVELERAKDEFIALASHQLRTPASGVKQYLGMILQGYAGKPTKDQLDMVRRAYDSNERQLAIVNDLLQVARADAGKIKLNKQVTDLHALITDIINEQTGTLKERKQQFHFKGEAKIFADVDAQYLRMAIENLIDNASKYSPEGKPIIIKLRQTDDKTVVSVSDEGVGIETENLKDVFNKFYRLTSANSTHVSGTGLGLYWVKKIVELHGGTVVAKRRRPQGSTFTITLPH